MKSSKFKWLLQHWSNYALFLFIFQVLLWAVIFVVVTQKISDSGYKVCLKLHLR